jgi:hypothetical protein
MSVGPSGFIPRNGAAQWGTMMNGAPVQEDAGWLEEIARRIKSQQGQGEAALGFTDDPDAYQNLLQMFQQEPLADYGTRAGLQGASISPALRDSPRVMLANELQKRSKKKSKPEKREKDHR